MLQSMAGLIRFYIRMFQHGISVMMICGAKNAKKLYVSAGRFAERTVMPGRVGGLRADSAQCALSPREQKVRLAQQLFWLNLVFIPQAGR